MISESNPAAGGVLSIGMILGAFAFAVGAERVSSAVDGAARSLGQRALRVVGILGASVIGGAAGMLVAWLLFVTPP